MVRRVAIALLLPVRWAPPGVDLARWRHALADDVLDVLAAMAEVEPAVAVQTDEEGLLGSLGWPGLRRYALATLSPPDVFAAAAADGFDQAALVPCDAPDLPGMLIAKLLRPLTSHPVAAAPAIGGSGLVGLSATLPAPDWLAGANLSEDSPQSLRRNAPQPSAVAPASGWHRLRGPDDLARLDPRLEGWDATRALLSAPR